MTTATGEIVRGVVSKANATGVALVNRQGWLNVSKFAEGRAVPPMVRGDIVELHLDVKGFIRSAIVTAPVSGGSEPVAVPAEPASQGPSKDVLIIRQCALKAAAEFCASRPELRSSDLFCLAEKMEAWVLR